MKVRSKIILILFVMFFLLLLYPVYGATNEEVPESVMTRAKEVNYGHDNFVILKDEAKGIYYIPYLYSSSSSYDGNWKVTIYKDVVCLHSPGWQRLSWRPYNPSTYGDVQGSAMNDISSNSVVQLYTSSRNLKVVYSYKNIIANGAVEGVASGGIWYDTVNNYSFEYPFLNNSDKELSDLSCDYIYIKPRYGYKRL